MSLTVKEPDNIDDFELIPAALYHGICYAIHDLGTQKMIWNGKEKLTARVRATFELPEVRMDIEGGGNLPRSIGKEYTASLSPKADLLKDLVKWRGKSFTDAEKKGFLLTKLLGVNCTLQIIHYTGKSSGKTSAIIETILPLMQGTSKKIPENTLQYFEFGEGMEIPESTPDWLKEKIMEAAEWNQPDEPSEANVHSVEEPEEEIPF